MIILKLLYNIILITDQGVHDSLCTSDANTETATSKGKTNYVKLSLKKPPCLHEILFIWQTLKSLNLVTRLMLQQFAH